jgi:hypothetical protein
MRNIINNPAFRRAFGAVMLSVAIAPTFLDQVMASIGICILLSTVNPTRS